MKNPTAIDIARLFIAFAVVSIHCGVSEINEHVYNIFQGLVPLFFVISGYFIENKRVAMGKYINDYVSKSCKLYILWSVIYLPLTIYGWSLLSH